MILEEAFRLAMNIKWESIEKDNMEFECKNASVYQVEAIETLAAFALPQTYANFEKERLNSLNNKRS